MTQKAMLIVAYDKNRGIGFKDDLPWPNNKDDMRHFSQTTNGRPVIMGRKTWDSIPDKYRPLKERVNVVVSRTLDSLPGAFVCRSLEEAVEKTSGLAYIMGGASIYTEALEKDLVHTIVASEMDGEFECDTFFPELSDSWVVSDTSSVRDGFTIRWYKTRLIGSKKKNRKS